MLRRALTSSWPAAVLTVLGVSAVLAKHAVPELDLLRYGGYLLLCVAFPGVLVWRMLTRDLHRTVHRAPSWFEDLTLGTIFGFGLQLPFFLVGVAADLPLLPLLVPALAGVLSLLPLGRRTWRLPTGRLHPAASWALSAVVLYGVVWLDRNIFPARPLWLRPNQTQSIDETFHLALISDITHRFPPEIPFLLGVRLDYHWFVHAQIAAATDLTGISWTVMLRLVMPALCLVLGGLGIGAVALRLSRRPVAAVVAPALLIAGAYQLIGPTFDSGTFYEPYMAKRVVLSPSQTYGLMVSAPALMLILEVLRPRRRATRLTWTALGLSLLALTGAKATFLPIFLCGAIAAWVVSLLRNRRVDWSATALVVLVAIMTGFAQLVLFGGRGGAMAYAPFDTVAAALRDQEIEDTGGHRTTMFFALLVGWLLYGVGLLGLKRRLLDPRAVLLAVSVAAGVTVPFVFFRTGLSQLWFNRTTAELVVLLSAWGLACALPRPLTLRHALRYGALAAAAGAAAYLGAVVAGAAQDTRNATPENLLVTVLVPVGLLLLFLLARVLARAIPRLPRPPLALLLVILLGLGSMNVYHETVELVTGGPVPGPSDPDEVKDLFHPGGAKAASVIADRSPVDAVVATNVHCRKPRRRHCDNRSFWVTALTERRVVVEGWGYNAETNANFIEGIPNAWLPVPFPRRLAINDAAFLEPSPETLNRLVETYGVSWLFVNKRHPADVEDLAALADGGSGPDLLEEEFESKHYVVYRVVA